MMSKLDSIKKESIQAIVIDANDFNIDKDLLKKINQMLKKEGSLFVLSSFRYSNDVLIPTPLEIANMIKSHNFFLRNSIVWFMPENNFSYNGLFVNRYKMIFHFTKDVDDYFFNKDPIREKHIWEKVEWGKRKKNYNPRGKDPGDVWLKTEDNGNAIITKHVPLSKEETILRCILLSTQKKDKVILFLNDQKCKEVCEENARTIIA